MDIVTLALAQKYTDDALAGGGAIKGDTGDSAYEVAVKNGFVGSETDWLNSLKGADGTNGKDGKDGATGPQGPAGPQGIQGNSGGVTTPLTGFFTMYVDTDSNLWVLSESDMSNYFEYDSTTGALYFLTETGV